MDFQNEDIVIVAETIKQHYDAFIKAGFTEAQAMKLIEIMIKVSAMRK